MLCSWFNLSICSRRCLGVHASSSVSCSSFLCFKCLCFLFVNVDFKSFLNPSECSDSCLELLLDVALVSKVLSEAWVVLDTLHRRFPKFSHCLVLVDRSWHSVSIDCHLEFQLLEFNCCCFSKRWLKLYPLLLEYFSFLHQLKHLS